MLLLEHARETVGLPVRAVAFGLNIGWTTDAEKAEQMREAGAKVEEVTTMSGRLLGYEVSFAIGTVYAQE